MVLALAATRPVFNADWVIIGGSGTVRSVVDWNGYATDGHVFDQPDTLKQCAPPAFHADFAGNLCLNFTGAEYYDSNRAPIAWVWAHDGTGFDGYFAITNLRSTATPQALFATMNVNTAASTGMAVQIDQSAGNFGFYTVNGSAYVVNVGNPSQFPNGTPGWANVSYKEGLPSGEVIKRKGGTTLFSGNTAGTPSSSAPTGTFRLGASVAGTLFQFKGRLRSTAFFPRLTDRTIPDSWMVTDTGIAA
jgi:hypothetical protein